MSKSGISPPSPPVEAIVGSDSERFPPNLPSYGQSQLQTLYETLCDEKSTDTDQNYDAFLANSLQLTENKLGRDVTLEELKQIFDGVLPETTDSTDPKIAKNRPKPQTVVATTGSGIPLADAPRLSRQEAESEETTTDDQSGEDSDPEVERTRRAFLKAKKKKKRAKTVNNVPLESTHKAPDELLKWFSSRLQSVDRQQLETLVKSTCDDDSAEGLLSGEEINNLTPTSPDSGVVQIRINRGTVTTRIDSSFNRGL